MNELYIYMCNSNVYIEVDGSYGYALSDGYIMKLFLNNLEKIKQMTEDSFIKWLKLEIEESCSGSSSGVSFKVGSA